jgi:Raf kinase inhibitor-like YbhB/YbcL family protein
MKFSRKEILVIVVLAVLAVVVVGGIMIFKKTPTNQLSGNEILSSPNLTQGESQMKLSSSAFENNQSIPAKYTCDGENVNPPLVIVDVTEGTQSLALIVDDPDAPGGTFTHWLVWNIDPQTTEITEGGIPSEATQGKNDFGKNGWGGPCPPSGTHRYFFKLYALDKKIDLSQSANKGDLEREIKGHILSQTQLVGLYNKGR